MVKKCIISLVLCIAFFCNIEKVNAAFNLNITNASYDSNTGYLALYDSNFFEKNSTGYFSATLSKIKLGGVSVTGYYQFSSGMLKINVSNKESVNEHINSSQNDIIQNGLYLSYGAISKNTYPPNSINVVVSSLSNEKTTNLNVVKLIPKITIDSFTSNALTLNSDGGEIIVTITGDNLDVGLLKVHNINSSATYNLTINKKNATARINISTNLTTKNRTDVFVLYLNGYQTAKTISVTVLPMKLEQSDTNSDANNNHSNNGNNNSNDKNNNLSDSSKNKTDNNNRPNNGNDNSNNSNNILKDDNVKNTSNKDFSVKDSNKKINEKSKYIIALPIMAIIIIGILLFVKRRKNYKK